jgi:hypothetical protein
MKKSKTTASPKTKAAEAGTSNLFTRISERHFHVAMGQFKKPGQVSLAMAF